MERINCWKCKTNYYLPDALYAAAKASPDISFFCPYGHAAHFPEGLSKIDIQRQRAEKAEQQIEYQRQRADDAERREAAQKGQVTKLKNRVKNGVCPCCNRSFANLRRHMTSKHPNFEANEPNLKVIEGGAARGDYTTFSTSAMTSEVRT